MNVKLLAVVVIFLTQKVFIARATHCETESTESCRLYFAWQGCYDISIKLHMSFEQALGYEELIRQAPINNNFETWQLQIEDLVCLCAKLASELQYDYFALQFYSVCFAGAYLPSSSKTNNQSCLDVYANKCEEFNQSLCLRVGQRNGGIAIYKLVQGNSTLPPQCIRNKLVNGGADTNVDGNAKAKPSTLHFDVQQKAYSSVQKSSHISKWRKFDGILSDMKKNLQAESYQLHIKAAARSLKKGTKQPNKLGQIDTKNNKTEDSEAALRRMLKEIDACVSIDQILEIVRKIIGVFGRPEIYQSFGVFKELQESFVESLSRIVGDDFKHLWKKTPKVQYLVEMVHEMSVLTLRSLSFTNKTRYSVQTSNIDIAANISNGETSLEFNDTTSGSSVILDNSLQGKGSRPSSIAGILYKSISEIFPAITSHAQQTSSNNRLNSSNHSLSAVASSVISIVSMKDGKLIKRINGTIRLINMIKNQQERLQTRVNYACVYWKENSSLALGGAWSTSGLATGNHHGNRSSANYFTCRTNHLTSFAVLMQIKEFVIPPEHEFTLSAITYVGCSLSLLCLLLTTISIPIMRLQETRFMIHLHLCTALAMSQALFLAGIAAIKNKTACMVIAMLLHYFYTAAFMWMLVEGIHLYQKVVIAYLVRNIKEKLYFLFAWGFPFVIVGIAFAANRDGYGTRRGCWLSLEKGFRWAFITPVIIVLLANFVILIRVLMVMVSLQSDPLRTEKHGKIRLAIKGVAILLPLLGLTWVFGIISVNSDTIVFQYLFAIFNSLQGVFIFTFNYASNKEVRMSFRRTINRSQQSSLL